MLVRMAAFRSVESNSTCATNNVVTLDGAYDGRRLFSRYTWFVTVGGRLTAAVAAAA